mgnify:CR=1 FL=1
MKKVLIALVFAAGIQPAFAQEKTAEVMPPSFEGCEQVATPKEGQDCFYRHLMTAIMTELSWPEDLKEEGKVFVEIKYNERAELAQIEVKRTFSESASKEVERTLRAIELPKSPAYQGDKPVSMSYVLPVMFKK